MKNKDYEVANVDAEELRKQLKQEVINTGEYCFIEVYVPEEAEKVAPYANFQSNGCSLLSMALAVAIAEDAIDTLKEKIPKLQKAINAVKKGIKGEGRFEID